MRAIHLTSTLVAAIALSVAVVPVSAGVGAARAASQALAAPSDGSHADRIRTVMIELRDSIAAHAASRGPDAEEGDRLAELGRKMQPRVTALFECCTRTGPASRSLHLSLSDMADGLALMQHAARADARRVGLAKVVQALNEYAATSAYPDWRTLDASVVLSAR